MDCLDEGTKGILQLTEFLAAQKTGALLSTSDCSPARRICHWADIAAMAAMAVLFSIRCDSQEDAIRETQVDLGWRGHGGPGTCHAVDGC